MITKATDNPQMTNKTYLVTQYITMEVVVDVEATSEEIAQQKAWEWYPTFLDGCRENHSYRDENNGLQLETYTLGWEITDIIDIDQREVTELDDE